MSEMKSNTHICYKVKQGSIFVTPASRYWSPHTERKAREVPPTQTHTRAGLLSCLGRHQVTGSPCQNGTAERQPPSCWAILSSFLSVISKDKEL